MSSHTPVTPKGKMQVNLEMSWLIVMVDTYFKQKYQSTDVIDDRLSYARIIVYAIIGVFTFCPLGRCFCGCPENERTLRSPFQLSPLLRLS